MWEDREAAIFYTVIISQNAWFILFAFNLKKNFFFLLHWVFVAMSGLSLVEASEGFSLVAVRRLLTVVAYLVAEHRLQGCRLQQLQLMGSVVVMHRLIGPAAYGIFLDQGSNPCSLLWQADS